MIWLAWRRRRGAVIATATALLVAGTLLFLTGRSMWNAFHDGGLAACIEGLGGRALGAGLGRLPGRGTGVHGALLLDATVGPGLVHVRTDGRRHVLGRARDRARARGRHGLWTQGVSRRRWAWTQLAFAAFVAAAAMGVLAWIATWWYGPLNAATGDRFQWLIYDQQGLVPFGYAVFATLLAAFIGATTDRTVRAMAITAVGFIVIRFGIAVFWRPRFMAGLERTYPVVTERVPNRLLGDWLYGGGGPGVGVVMRANGERVTGGQRVCPPTDPACFADIGQDAFNLEMFHPASRFWTFQSIGTAIFLAFALALAAATVWWVGKRLT